MPQFDLYCFSTQVFWVCLLFFLFYFIFSQVFLPEMAYTLKLRAKRKTLSLEGGSKKIAPFSFFVVYLLS
jgi:hypothetical protein